MDCNTCKNVYHVDPVPYIVHESAMARNERTVRRLVVGILIALGLLVLSNACWLWAWTSYDYTGEETFYQQDGEGLNIIGNGNEAEMYGTESNPADANTD